MQAHGLQGVELAPTKVWPDPTRVAPEAALAHLAFWQGFGIEVVAFQSLLFGQPGLSIFTSAAARRETLAHLTGIIHLAAQVGARALVFGSPGARKRGDLSVQQAMGIAVEFFRELGEVASRNGTCVCVEPNPAAYGCDFIQTAEDGRSLVKAVSSPGFRLHLDAGALALNQEDPEREIEASFEWLAHFHASEPNLSQVGPDGSRHRTIGQVLRRLGYEGYVSVEMRAATDGNNTATVDRALDVLVDAYG